MSNKSKSIPAVSLCILLAACGGGGSDTQLTTNTSGSSTNQELTPSGNTSGNTSTPPSGHGANTAPALPPSNNSGDTGNSASPTFAYDTTARFNAPSDITVDQTGNLYVMDAGTRTIRRIAANGEVSTLPGSYNSLRPAMAMSSAGDVYVMDLGNLYRISPTGARTTVMTYPSVAGSVQPVTISTDTQGYVYVLAQYRTRFWVHQIDPNNPPQGVFFGNGKGPHRSIYEISTNGNITDIATDAQGNLAVSTSGPVSGTSSVRYVPQSVQPVTEPSTAVSVWPLELGSPSMTFDSAGNLYVATVSYSSSSSGGSIASNMRILKVAPNGTSTTVFSGFPDGSTSRQTSAFHKVGIAVAANGDMYVTDPFAHAIYRISAEGQVTLIAGKEGEAGSAD